MENERRIAEATAREEGKPEAALPKIVEGRVSGFYKDAVLIEQAFDTLLRGRTSVIIAHRLATVRRADEILVLEKGRITQRGTEAELLAEEGPFRRLAATLHGMPVRDVA